MRQFGILRMLSRFKLWKWESVEQWNDYEIRSKLELYSDHPPLEFKHTNCATALKIKRAALVAVLSCHLKLFWGNFGLTE